MDTNLNKTFVLYKMFFILFIFCSLTLLVGCKRTEYVCYDGTTKKSVDECQAAPTITVTEQDAGNIADNYGRAVANAKRDTYTRVNVYEKNSTWYANVLFTNSQSGNIAKILLRIHGQTGDVSCVTGCEYLTPSDTSVAQE